MSKPFVRNEIWKIEDGPIYEAPKPQRKIEEEDDKEIH